MLAMVCIYAYVNVMHNGWVIKYPINVHVHSIVYFFIISNPQPGLFGYLMEVIISEHKNIQDITYQMQICNSCRHPFPGLHSGEP